MNLRKHYLHSHHGQCSFFTTVHGITSTPAFHKRQEWIQPPFQFEKQLFRIWYLTLLMLISQPPGVLVKCRWPQYQPPSLRSDNPHTGYKMFKNPCSKYREAYSGIWVWYVMQPLHDWIYVDFFPKFHWIACMPNNPASNSMVLC